MMKMMMLFFWGTIVLSAQSPLINEVMSLNSSVIEDNDGDYADWIELYNPHSAAVSLQNYALSDDIKTPQKWIFPKVVLPSRGFLLIFASGKDRRSEGLPLHTNFKIKSKGEQLFLFSPDGVLVDSISVIPLAVDVSYGRTPDGSEQWYTLASPTPRFSNTAPANNVLSEMPRFSPAGGFLGSATQVTLSASSDLRIVYTTDGSDPNNNSRSYLSPIKIGSTTVLKARVLKSDGLAGAVSTHTYMINDPSTIAVVSLSTHPDNLFDDDIGIYVTGNSSALGGYPDNPIGPPANYWEDWERPVHIELFEPDGRLGFSINAGIKMFGKTTRNLPQKSFALFMRAGYGQGELEYPLFPEYPITRFKSFLLRNGGSDNTINEGGVHFRDGLAARLLYGFDLDFQAYRPCHVYINGEYWGIYNLREKINEDYLENHYGVNPNKVDILDDYHRLYPLVVEGNADHFNALIDYLKSHDLAVQAAADYVSMQMDVNNYLAYMAVQIFFANHDGPGHNCKFWRDQEGGIYRWLLYDTDHSFGQRLFIPNFHYAPDDGYKDNTIAYYREANGPSWPNPPESTFLFRKILENARFRHLFINTLADLMNSRFSEETTLTVFDKVRKTIEPEIEKQLQRWGGDKSQWTENVAVVDNFFAYRAEYLQEHVIQEFGLDGLAEIKLRVQPAGAGQLYLNSLAIEQSSWSGLYYKNVPIQLTAVAAPGYRLSIWQEVGDTSSKTTITPKKDMTITAVFEPAAIVPMLVINEINYNSPPNYDTEDWIELYNPLDKTVDISSWALMDDDSSQKFIFPKNTFVAPQQFIIVCRDPETFKNHWNSVNPILGPLLFALNNDGDFIQLCNSDGAIVDSLNYSDRTPWPRQPDGNGATLALRYPDLDNSVAENWMASFSNGTPGNPNRIIGAVSQELFIPDFKLFSAYPNPFNGSTTIHFFLPLEKAVRVEIFNILGRPITVLEEGRMTEGIHEIQWSGRDERDRAVSSGIYLIVMTGKNLRIVQKIALIE